MAINKASITSWLEQGHDWLFAFDDIRIHNSLSTFRKQMLAALQGGNKPDAAFMRSKLVKLNNRFQAAKQFEKSEHHTLQAECGFVAYMIGDTSKGFEQLKDSLKLSNPNDHGHFHATATWMLGCMLWDLGRDTDAIICWESSIDGYKTLKRRSERYPSDATSRWYADRIKVMENALSDALGKAPSPPPPKYPNYEDFGSTPGSESSPAGSSYFTEEDILRLFNISHEIKAGDFSVTNGNGGSGGYLEVDRVKIDGRPHRIVNLRRSGRVIRYGHDKKYRVIKVDGDSMNAEGIDDGDSILLQSQNTADNNDIVAAMIHNTDTTATLKKYQRIGNRVILKFCSRNPIHKDSRGYDKQFEFDSYGDGFDIVGVALAVFKPV